MASSNLNDLIITVAISVFGDFFLHLREKNSLLISSLINTSVNFETSPSETIFKRNLSGFGINDFTC